MSFTPFFAQVAPSVALMAREALVMSGYSTPTPPQKSLNPPPDPVDSILGVLKRVLLPYCSATTVAKG